MPRRYVRWTVMTIGFSILLTAYSKAAAGLAVVSSPMNWQVIQRNNNNLANIPVKVRLTPATHKVIVRLLDANSQQLSVRSYTREQTRSFENITDINYAAEGGGWYQVQVSLFDKQGVKVAERTIPKVGVGEVFLTAGQSNSVRNGEKPIVNKGMTSFAEYVDSTGRIVWRHDIDQATDRRGSTWTPFAERMAAKLKVPIGIAMVGCGGTVIAQWLPKDKGVMATPEGKCGLGKLKGGLYARLLDATHELKNFRAILWHQGESEIRHVNDKVSSLVTYPKNFRTVVSQLNSDTGKTIPWIAATVSYIPGIEVLPEKNCEKSGKPIQHLTAMNKFRAMRLQIVKDNVALLGPDSDVFWGPYRGPVAGDCIHLSYEGQVGLGLAWSASVLSHFKSLNWGKVY